MLVTLAIVFGGVLAGVAVVLAALAAQGMPTWRRGLTPEILARETKYAQRSAVWQLSWSRWTALAAALLLFAAIAGVWLVEATADTTDGTTVTALVVRSDGTAMCGLLTVAEGGTLQFQENKSSAPAPLTGVVQLTETDGCPSH